MKAFLDAAQAFVDCEGRTTQERRAYFRNAGECFVKGGNNRKAAESYLAAEEFTLSVRHYHQGSMVDDAVNVVQSHHAKIETDVANTIINVARIYYLKERKMEYVSYESRYKSYSFFVHSSKAKKLFDTYEEALEFTEDYDLDVARATLLESMGRLSEAAELHLTEGRQLQAISLFLKDRDDPNSQRRARECILQGLWGHISFGVPRESFLENDTLIRLLELASKFDQTAEEVCL